MSHNNLFLLVHSLSKEEKRYFKVSASLKKTKKSPKYVRLFDLLEKQTNYDEAILRQNKFNGADQNYLKEKLLETLVAFNKQKSIEAQLYQLLAQLPILYQKKLWSLLEKQIQQGKKMALSYEQHWFYLKLLEWEWQLHVKNKLTSKQLSALNKEQSLYVQQLGKTYDYQYLRSQAALLLSQSVQGTIAQRSKAKDLLTESTLLTEYNSLNTLTNQIYFYQLKSRQAILEGKYLIAYQHIQQCKVLFECNADFQSIHQIWHQDILCMCLEIQLASEQLESYPQVLQQLKCLSNHSTKTTDLVCNKIHFKGLLYFLRMGDFDKCFLLIEDLKENWATYQPLLKPSREITYYYNITLAYLFTQSWQQAQEWLHKTLALKMPSIRKDLQHGVRILLLLLTYETDQNNLLKSIDAAYKYFNRHQQYNTFEQEVIKYFKLLYKAFGHQEEKIIFVAFLDTLRSLETNIPSGIELLLWCQSKVESRSLPKVYLEAIKGKK